MAKKNNITPYTVDFAKWYSDLVIQSELISYGPVKGTMYFRPYGYKIWNLIKSQLNEKFNSLEIDEVSFPLLFPESFLNKEKNHVQGFAPEVLKVTMVGEKKLNEPLIIRPTSETLFNDYFANHISSYKQLPIKLNQWVNIMRWENNTRPFLRNSEFLWQEGHTVHATKKEAKDFSQKMIRIYEEFANNILNIPVLSGEKSISERFAGAEQTFTIESILKDGQALQSGTSHYLADNFTKTFNVKVLGSDNKQYNPFQTSWGVSTRLMGAIIMTHSDDNGLVLPSKVAPHQIVIMTLFADKNPEILNAANNLKQQLSNHRVKIDSSNKGIGFKSQDWEVKGVPLRIELGPKELENKQVVIVRRDTNEKQIISPAQLTNDFITKVLKEYTDTLETRAMNLRNAKRVIISDKSELASVIESGKWALSYWTESITVEAWIKEEMGASVRVLIISNEKGKCIHSGLETNTMAVIARAY